MSSCRKTINTSTPTSVISETLTNVSYGNHPKQTMDIYLPSNRTTSSTKVLIAIHGGGLISGDKSDLAEHVETLRKRLPGYAIFNINYRLAINPDTLFP